MSHELVVFQHRGASQITVSNRLKMDEHDA